MVDQVLIHYGIKGQKWGVRRYQNPDGTYTNLGKKRRGTRLFVSGSSKTQDEASVYRRDLPEEVKNVLKEYMSSIQFVHIRCTTCTSNLYDLYILYVRIVQIACTFLLIYE
jgi:hypothetical protein